MCVVSMVIDYTKDRNPIFPAPWTTPPPPWTIPNTNPFPHPLPSEGTPFDMSKILPTFNKPRDPTSEEIEEWIKKNRYWTKEKFNQLMVLIEEAKRMDALMGEPNCEDPLKVEFLDELKKLVGYMEANQKSRSPKKPRRPPEMDER